MTRKTTGPKTPNESRLEAALRQAKNRIAALEEDRDKQRSLYELHDKNRSEMKNRLEAEAKKWGRLMLEERDAKEDVMRRRDQALEMVQETAARYEEARDILDTVNECRLNLILAMTPMIQHALHNPLLSERPLVDAIRQAIRDREDTRREAEDLASQPTDQFAPNVVVARMEGGR
jgi:hypothetical protein